MDKSCEAEIWFKPQSDSKMYGIRCSRLSVTIVGGQHLCKDHNIHYREMSGVIASTTPATQNEAYELLRVSIERMLTLMEQASAREEAARVVCDEDNTISADSIKLQQEERKKAMRQNLRANLASSALNGLLAHEGDALDTVEDALNIADALISLLEKDA